MCVKIESFDQGQQFGTKCKILFAHSGYHLKVNWVSNKQPPEVFCRKGVLRNCTKFTEKHLCQSLPLNKVTGCVEFHIETSHLFCSAKQITGFYIKWNTACNFIQKDTLTQVLYCEFCEISKNTFSTEHLWWLLVLIKEIKKSRN